ncbi:SusD/RagB family nutrient-binding outer membrane lipoprotein [Galbibacter pacificus]|uniref:SusD/RagB family nutrient-binding outer membrane lipoprotein n=1 Tax=Galbibacter pacificus TaxID=2996052 RepID=A0ABT6FMV4_9FLAO|nr:SusD/RagB family nutrient-binding outer membrane lipoprotein [Galbibacter pacificus]MDG3581119.1 SusD/RagB family nutrient-binding outer membrane lipoprotein [Galbibacter pacificus]MDG3584597.1 SusD/RagB family nutrient-binding outer membrane lipoprotein [Galbibacter pacificus]
MKNIKYIIFCLAAYIMAGCTSDFEEVNTDPNLISEISPGTLINPIIYGLATHNADRSASITFDLMQVSLPFPSVSGGLHRYDVSQNIGNSSWYWYYRWLNNIDEMKEAAISAEDANYEAIALTLNAWVYANLTDLFGPVPMTEASQGEGGILYPAFDSQESIYQTILDDLEKANAMYETDEDMIYAEDILFFNDVMKWKKFTNSLHMRLLLRISNKTETNAFQKLTAMINNPSKYPVFESTDESAILQVTGVTPNVSPWGRPQDFRLNVKVASFFLDNLNQFEDPRRPFIATLAHDENNEEIGYKGIPSAYSGPESQFDYDASTFNIEQVENPMQIFLLTYAEVEFIKAEVAQRGFIDNAETHYENGVKAAIEQIGAEVEDSIFDNPDVAYNGSLEQIMLQKYYALYFTDYQQWFEYRRTGLPVLPTTDAMQNNAMMPSRFYYPSDVQINNQANYQEAVEMLGGPDDINTKVWWDE